MAKSVEVSLLQRLGLLWDQGKKRLIGGLLSGLKGQFPDTPSKCGFLLLIDYPIWRGSSLGMSPIRRSVLFALRILSPEITCFSTAATRLQFGYRSSRKLIQTGPYSSRGMSFFLGVGLPLWRLLLFSRKSQLKLLFIIFGNNATMSSTTSKQFLLQLFSSSFTKRSETEKHHHRKTSPQALSLLDAALAIMTSLSCVFTILISCFYSFLPRFQWHRLFL